MNKRLIAVLVGVLAIGALVAGCGGGDDDGESGDGGGATALTKAEFIEQGDAICAKANKQSEADAEDFAEENDFELEKASKDQLEEAVAEVLVPSLNQQIDELQALGAPEGDEERVEAIFVALEDAAGEIEDDPSSVFEGAVLKEPSQLAEAYGFEVCGEE